MKPINARTVGTLLMITACLGLVISLGGLILLGYVTIRVSASLGGTLEGISQALTISQNGLTAAESALNEADAALSSLADTIDSVSGTIQASDAAFQSLTTLLGTDLPATIRATQGSLASAEVSAKNIDGLLTTLSGIPLFGKLVYNPDIPLNETIGSISDSLDAIPVSLGGAKRGVDDVRTSLQSVTGNLADITASTDQITASTQKAQQVIDDYQTLVTRTQEQITSLQENLAGKIRLAAGFMALLLIWLGLAQFGLFTQGLELRARGRSSQNPAVID